MVEETSALRARMVNNQLRTFDVTDHRVQDAFAAVARERYVPAASRIIAYSDVEIPVAEDSIGRPTRTMTRPAVLARLLQLARIEADDVVLVVGAGLGYTAAVVGLLAGSVIALEVDPALAERASAALEEADVANVAVVTGPLPDGYPSEAPYDVILIDGAVEIEPTTLVAQLKPGGRLVAIHGRGLAGRAMIAVRGDTGVSVRYAFNAAAMVLPGFAEVPTFTF